MTALTCPFCNTAFDLPSIPGRVVCPRCGEAIPAKLLPVTAATAASVEAPSPVEAAPAKPGTKTFAIAALMVAAILGGLGIWYSTTGNAPDTVNTDSAPPPATRPPMALPGLRYMPPGTQIAIALQPSSLVQYAARADVAPEVLLERWGLPAGLFAGLKKAGIELDHIEHIVVGVGLTESPLPRLSIALFLRRPVGNERLFRETLKLRQNADKPGRAKVELPGIPLPMEMHTIDEMLFLFSSDDKVLDGMIKPQESLDFLKPGLRESMAKIDPASFAWVATDNVDWANLPTLKFVAPLIQQPELPKKLKGIRSLAFGMGLRPDLAAQAHVRFEDAKTASEFEARAQAKLAVTKVAMAVTQEWVMLSMPGGAYADGMAVVLGLFDR